MEKNKGSSNKYNDEFKKLAKIIADLTKQIEMNDYKDSLGHSLKNNKAYLDLKELIKA
ncbi:hypothetical protein Z962_p0050 (plasmid) [Clostridium botulinum C/D str. BKT12695]|nr:hypothetical protein Z962_p0050 [Clostridium botulinum C/D str. BKT12695]